MKFSSQQRQQIVKIGKKHRLDFIVLHSQALFKLREKLLKKDLRDLRQLTPYND